MTARRFRLQLGRSIAVFKGTFASGGWLWYIGAVLLAAAIANTAKGEGILALASFVAGLLCLVAPVLRWQQRVELFEGGMVWQRLLGTVTVPREVITAVQQIEHRSRQGVRHELVVERRDGRSLSIVGIERMTQLREQLLSLGRPAAVATGWVPPGAAS
jgi:hypothetical protein